MWERLPTCLSVHRVEEVSLLTFWFLPVLWFLPLLNLGLIIN